MTKQPIEDRQKVINGLLRSKRLNEAFAELRQLASETANWQITNKVEELEQSYKYMIQYATEGIADPQRNQIYDSIINKAAELTDIAANELLIQTSPRIYYSTLRTLRLHPSSLAILLGKHSQLRKQLAVFFEMTADEQAESSALPMLKDKEAVENTIFNYIWTAYPMNNDDLETVRQTLADDTQPAVIHEVIISALMMSLLEHYREELLLCLLDFYSTTTVPALQIKALCCALLVMHRHRDAIRHSEPLRLRIGNLADNPQATADIMTLFLQFIRSRGTERVMKKVRDELIPRIRDLSPELRRKLENTNAVEDLENGEINPDWQEVLDKSGITAKMQELNKMQMEGSDVFLSTFSQMKNFPFFRTTANWFIPFEMTHSEVYALFKNKMNPMLTMIEKSGAFCDSDKFSFILSLASVPEQQRQMMLGQFDAQNEQMMEMSGNLPDPAKDRENTANKYVQNLYRFFNLSFNKKEFYNPFSTTLNLIEVPFVADILSDLNSLQLIAEFYFKQEYYNEALAIFNKIAQQETATVGMYQKMGFCHESAKNYEEAIRNYEKVDLLKSDDAWTLKHLAGCHRSAGNSEKALEYFKRVETLQPDNTAVANSIANCLLALGRTDEALKYFFKVDYMANKGARTMRPIAWCSFLTGNYEQSISYYDRIIALDASADDLINRSHALLCAGRTKEATVGYVNAMKAREGSLGKVIDTLHNDRQLLLDAGIDGMMLALIEDKLRYSA